MLQMDKSMNAYPSSSQVIELSGNMDAEKLSFSLQAK